MAPPKSSYPTTASPGYSNIDEAQENDLKSNLMKMIESLEVEINKSFREIQENTNKCEGNE